MVLKGKEFSFTQLICLALYYGFAIYLPPSNKCFHIGGWTRRHLCRRIFKKCGRDVNIEKGAVFGRGTGIEIGDHSGIGINAAIPGDTIIGSYVMMGPNCYILGENHRFDNTEIPMMLQGFTEKKQTIIDDDVWIGRCVTITPGRHIRKGTVIGACAVLSKDFPEYSVVAGNPARLIRTRDHGRQ